ncbi:MAG: diphthine synthase [Candidatus Thermoplasmatota archaeon]|nr:diphthine synthase [Candidatus Thermoplasmatota archaeon]
MGKLYLIGLGLYDEKDITLKGLEAARSCDKLYAEFYTAILSGSTLEKLEEMIGKKIEVLPRVEVESGKKILEDAKTKTVALLTAGDPMTATTHLDIRIRAMEKGIETQIIHGTSIFSSAPGVLGLQHYKFGRTTTVPYPEGNYLPESPYDVIKENQSRGLHTLVLLDIRAEEKERRFMTANECIEVLLRIEAKRGEKVFTEETLIGVIARAGAPKPCVAAGKVKDLRTRDFGAPLHTVIVPGKLHFLEKEALEKLGKI